MPYSEERDEYITNELNEDIDDAIEEQNDKIEKKYDLYTQKENPYKNKTWFYLYFNDSLNQRKNNAINSQMCINNNANNNNNLKLNTPFQTANSHIPIHSAIIEQPQKQELIKIMKKKSLKRPKETKIELKKVKKPRAKKVSTIIETNEIEFLAATSTSFPIAKKLIPQEWMLKKRMAHK
jgi:hypothetical protein